MSDARDELAEEIAGHQIGSGYYSTSVGMDEAREIADDLIEAGYQKLVSDPQSLAGLLEEHGWKGPVACYCGWKIPEGYYPRGTVQAHAAHQAEILAAAGYGKATK